jgi:predicted amidohydrolase
MKNIRIAAVVCKSTAGDIPCNLHRVARWAAKAKNQGISLICFPELNLTGYSSRANIKDWAQPIEGPIGDALKALAHQNRMTILAGMAEKGRRGNIYASHLVASPGKKLAVYRKLHLAPPEQAVFSAGHDIVLFRASDLCFGIQLCYDAHFPELTTTMALRGAELVFIPHASPRGSPEEKYHSWMRHLTARAYDNSLFVVGCNQAGNNNNGLTFPGVALIIGPSGNVLKKDVSGRESMLVANLKTADLTRVREHRMRYFLPNRRPELYFT